ncbi:M12 family metallo-peptidase [Terrimonas sp. NA20]|uniref:M12 family metallo-peptidase n=1 Tax=Terrimonas ginsenosidimutans TaxID=2908004 RepID=A0ABS9KXM8_9BACT|nr:zinc-dependent metalloprotease [Terrimonas ginsenosidimutans]MCG2617106.1 M12 family metallo-peptidase [Terrimonas ginsenosidimutans]
MRKFYPKAFLFLVLLICSSVLFAQREWKEVSESALGKDLFAGGRYKPVAYKIFQLDEPVMQEALKRAPKRELVAADKSAFIITIPNSDGIPERFRAVESVVMDPVLAAKYPDIKTYIGQGIDDPGSVVHFDFSPRGFHAMVLSADKKTMYIDPVDRDGKYYVIFSRKDVVNYKKEFRCLTQESADNSSFDVPAPPAGSTGRGADDAKLRTYRLALGCTGEYAQFFLNGSEANDAVRRAKVLAAMVTLMVRTNGIYERDFGIHMNLIATNDLVIYLDPVTDPWPSTLNGQANLDAVIGTNNYDIGHLVHRESSPANNNGNAGCIACVCKEGMKGRAFTSHFIPEGDPFVVDFTTHEMGHQFGANHTFSHNFEGSGVQMEPGSGSTIMGYAGITPMSDVQDHSDDYFHAASIQQVTDYVKGATGGGCAVVTSTGNNTPIAIPGNDYTIPRATPFTLTGSGSDADPGDILTYTWEQFNSATSAQTSINPGTAAGPLFRSMPYSTSPSRTFPQLSTILNNQNVGTWEKLPTIGRNLVFRLTVRDNHPAGGNTRDADMLLAVAANAGPFAVTSPNTAVSWGAGTTQTITWSVNNTNTTPVSCLNVKISISYDGGFTFQELVASTPNDGTHNVTLPANTSTTARIKVEAVGNIFFDISDVNFAITGPEFNFTTPAAVNVTCQQTTSNVTLGTTATLGFNTPVTLSLGQNNLPAGATITFGTNPVAPGNTSVVTLNNTNLLTAGQTYTVTITGTAGAMQKTRVLTFNVESQIPPAVTAQPQSVSTCLNSNTTLSVTATNAVSYQWQVSVDGGNTYAPAPGVNTGTTYTITSAQLAQTNSRYRVQVNGTCSQSINSSAAILTVIAPVVVSAQPAGVTICETGNVTFTAAGTSTIAVIYQWQVSTDGGNSFANIANGGAYSGATTATLAVNSVTSAMNNNRYRALLSNATCTATTPTNAATLTVNARPTVQLTATPLTDLQPGQTTTINAAINPAPIGFNITWTRNDQVLPGITGVSYLVDSVEVGNYKVSIVNPTTGCNNESNVLTIGATASSNLFIYPTPNNGTFTVSFYNSTGAAGRQTLAIYDTRGQQVYSTQLNVNGPYTLHSINLNGKARGIYYVVIGDGSGKKITESKVMIY